MYKAYRYRIYPTKNQEKQINHLFNCCRYTYNKTLDYLITQYNKNNKYITKKMCNKYLYEVISVENEWINYAGSYNLAINNNRAFDTFKKCVSKNKSFPKYKSEFEKQIFTIKNEAILNYETKRIEIEEFGSIKASLSRTVHGNILYYTITRSKTFKYHINFIVNEDTKTLPKTNKMVGIDMGVKELCITSDGVKYENPKAIKKYLKRLKLESRRLSRKKKNSKNYFRQKRIVSRLHEKIANTRKTELNKISSELVKNNDVIVSETLTINNMIQNSNNPKWIYDASWNNLIKQIEYKSLWNNRKFIKVGRYFPSSQLCSNCGFKNKKIKDLTIREWTCPSCNMTHDRDINAAKNLLKEGLKKIK